MNVKSILRFITASLLFSVPVSETIAAQGPQPSICNRSCWAARAPRCSISQMANLTRATIHHTANQGDFNTTGIESSKANVRATQNYHMDVNGWCDIGYHFLVDKFGNIFEGRSGSMTSLPKGAHDSVNTDSFGFNLMGYFHTPYNNDPPGPMRDALYKVIAWRMPSAWSPYGGSTYGGVGNVGKLCGHRNVKSTACPGDLVYNPYITGNLNGGEARDRVNSYKNNGSVALNNRVGLARTANGGGYWIAASDGGVFSFGNAVFYGSMGGQALNSPVVGIAARPQGDGYWLVAADGGIFSFGAAPFQGSMGGQPLNQPIVGIACTASGNGYWMVARDGGIFSFGDAPFNGSGGGTGLTDFVGMASTPANGYWLVRATGSIYSYGANYYGGGEAGNSVVGMASTSDGGGYWQTKNVGNIFTYGNGAYAGGLNELTCVGMARGPSNGGYWILKNNGAIYSFGDASYQGGANF